MAHACPRVLSVKYTLHGYHAGVLIAEDLHYTHWYASPLPNSLKPRTRVAMAAKTATQTTLQAMRSAKKLRATCHV